MSDGCYFCGGGADVLEKHHIVPRRHGGSDAEENLVDLCPTCHERLERLYDKRFYDRLGVRNGRSESDEQLLRVLEFISDTFPEGSEAFSYRQQLMDELVDEFNLRGKFCTACQNRTFIAPPRDDFDRYREFDGCCARCHTHVKGIKPNGTYDSPPGWFDE